MTEATKPRLQAHHIAASRREPRFYFEHLLGFTPTDYQVEIAESVRDNRETGVRSANGVGKSYISGAVASWWFDCWSPGKCFIAGPKFEKAKTPFDTLATLRANARFELPGLVMSGELRGSRDWWVRPVSAASAENLAGVHGSRVLVILEEASGLPDDIYQSAYGNATGENDRIMHIGNPLRHEGTFARLFKRQDVNTITISAYDSPNVKAGREVIPGIVSKAGVDMLVRAFGADSDAVRVRVHGLPPRRGGNSIFSIATIENAKLRGTDPMPAGLLPTFGGLDLARMGDDKCSLATIRGVRLDELDVWEKTPIDESAERAAAWLIVNPNARLAIDVGGLGVGVYDILRKRFGGRVLAVNFGGKQRGSKVRRNAGTGETTPWYADRRSELWYEASEWFRGVGEFGSLGDRWQQEIEGDLLGVEGGIDKSDRLRMEPKDATKKRIGRSPDLGDSVCLAVAALQAPEPWYSLGDDGDAPRSDPYSPFGEDDEDLTETARRHREWGGLIPDGQGLRGW